MGSGDANNRTFASVPLLLETQKKEGYETMMPPQMGQPQQQSQSQHQIDHQRLQANIGWAIVGNNGAAVAPPQKNEQSLTNTNTVRSPPTPQLSFADSLSTNSLMQQQRRQSTGVIRLPNSSAIVIQHPSGHADGCCLHQHHCHYHHQHLPCNQGVQHLSLSNIAADSNECQSSIYNTGTSSQHNRGQHQHHHSHRGEIFITDQLHLMGGENTVDGKHQGNPQQQVLVVSGWQPSSIVTTQSCKELVQYGSCSSNNDEAPSPPAVYANLPQSHPPVVRRQHSSGAVEDGSECAIYQTLPSNWPPPPVQTTVNSPPKPAARLSLLKKQQQQSPVKNRRRKHEHRPGELQQRNDPSSASESSPHVASNIRHDQQPTACCSHRLELLSSTDMQTAQQHQLGNSESFKQTGTKEKLTQSDSCKTLTAGDSSTITAASVKPPYSSPQRRVLFVPRGPLPLGGPDDLLHEAFLMTKTTTECTNASCPLRLQQQQQRSREAKASQPQLRTTESSSNQQQHGIAISDKEEPVQFNQQFNQLWTSRSYGDLIRQPALDQTVPCASCYRCQQAASGCRVADDSNKMSHNNEMKPVTSYTDAGLLVTAPSSDGHRSAFSPAGGRGYPPISITPQSNLSPPQSSTSQQNPNNRPCAFFMSDPASDRMVSVRLTKAVKLGLDEGISSSDWSRWDCIQGDQQAAALDRQHQHHLFSGRYHHSRITPPIIPLTSSSEGINNEPTSLTSTTMVLGRSHSQSCQRSSGHQLHRQDASIAYDSLDSTQEDNTPKKAPPIPPPYSWVKNNDN